jgi:hypothetical protein
MIDPGTVNDPGDLLDNLPGESNLQRLTPNVLTPNA